MSDETLAGTAAPRERDGDRRFRRRTTLLLVICSLVLAAVMGRLAQLQLRQHDHFRALRERQTRGVVVREQPRMKIAFRDGELAAQSVAATSIFVDPARIRDRAASARLLARALGWPTGRVQPLLAAESPSNPGRPCRFRWIKRWATAEETARVRALRLRGVGTRTEYRRRYPSGRLAAQILGGVGVDQQGLDGIELAGDALLRGTSESERVLRDARRRSIAVSADLSRLRDDGGALVLTVHRGVQWIVEAELDRVMAEHRPQWACAVVIDPANGDVLAMANRPTFDPNAFGAAAPASRRNRCVTDTYEPGSTFKPFFLAACLEEGLGRLDEKIGCENGAWTVSGRTIHDHHPYGALSLHDVVVKSSNVGAVKLGLRLSKARGVAGLRKWLADFGFGTETGIPLPGESGGRLMPLSRWSAYTTTSVPIGHEVAV